MGLQVTCPGPGLDAELSPHALGELLELPSETALREAIRAHRVRSHRAGGGGRRKVKLGEFLEDADSLPRCPCNGCCMPALSNAGGCGTPGHLHAGRPKSAKTRARMSTARVALREGSRPIAQVAAELGCSWTNLEAVARWQPGAANEKLIDAAEEERIKREHTCPQCGALAVGRSGYCRACAAPTILSGVPRPPEVRKAISEAKTGVKRPDWSEELKARIAADVDLRARLVIQLAAGNAAEDKHEARQLHAAGKADTASAAELLVYSRHTIWAAAARARGEKPVRQGLRRDIPIGYLEVTTLKGKVRRRIGLDPKSAGDSFNARTGSNDGYRRLSPALSGANGTDFGRPPTLTDTEVAEALALRAADRNTWSYRVLAAKFSSERAAMLTGKPAKPVSHMAVKRALDRATDRP